MGMIYNSKPIIPNTYTIGGDTKTPPPISISIVRNLFNKILEFKLMIRFRGI